MTPTGQPPPVAGSAGRPRPGFIDDPLPLDLDGFDSDSDPP